jgi:hypothetical protein
MSLILDNLGTKWREYIFFGSQEQIDCDSAKALPNSYLETGLPEEYDTMRAGPSELLKKMAQRALLCVCGAYQQGIWPR